MRYFKKMVGKKCYLSPINIEDAEKYTEWLNDLEVAINLTLAPQIISLMKEKETLEEFSKTGYVFAIVHSEKDELIGNCGLHEMDQVNRTAECGMFIGNKEYWDKGYGEEAANLLLDYAFNILNLNSLIA